MRNVVRSRHPVVAISALALIGVAASCASFGAAGDGPPPEADAAASERDQTAPDPDVGPVGSPADAAADAIGPIVGPCKGEAACTRFVFVSSALYAGEDIGSAIGADGRCNVRGSLPETLPALAGRTWLAWISDDLASSSASARLTHGTMPYRLPDGTLVANDWKQLTSGTLLHAIDKDERGGTVGDEFVWTGTQTSGQATTKTCTNWSISGAENTGTVGRASETDSTWTNSGSVTCGTSYRLYCFEQ